MKQLLQKQCVHIIRALIDICHPELYTCVSEVRKFSRIKTKCVPYVMLFYCLSLYVV